MQRKILKNDKMGAFPRIDVPSVPKHTSCPPQDQHTKHLGWNDNKHSLEMNTMLRNYCIWIAKGATGNKKLEAQNEPLFGFIPIYKKLYL